MNFTKIFPVWLASIICAILLLLGVAPVTASAEWTTPPPGFELIDSAPGVELFRKDYSGGTPDFVQVIDLSGEARIQLLHGSIAAPGVGSGAYGGDSPSFARQSLQQAWDGFAASDAREVCLVNGGFFSTNEDPAPLAFPLKADGQVVSEGYAANEYPDRKLMLEIWPDHAQISPLSGDALRGSSAPNILGGLSEDADKDPSTLIGRTFAGVQDANSDGQAEIVLIFSSKTSKQADAAAVLRAFGAQQVIMFDGGDSTQLICRNNPYVYSDRSIPQTIAVSSGTARPLAVKVTHQTDFQVIVEGESTKIELTLRNEGTETWRVGEVTLVNLHNDWGAGSRLELPKDVSPGETITFSWVTTTFPRWGVFTSEWDVARGDQYFADKPITINVIVLPQQLADKKTELEKQVREWGNQQLNNIKQLVLDWIQERIRQGLDKICPTSLSLPALVAAAGIWQTLRRRKNK